MPLHPEAAALLASLAADPDPPLSDATLAEVRFRRRSRIVPSAVPVAEVADVTIAGVPCRRYRDGDGGGVLVHFHGGGWVIGDLDDADDLCRRLAASSGHTVLSVGYRLAPEHPFPAALEDGAAVLREVAAGAAGLDCDPDRIAIGGDSAGGNLAAVLALESPVRFRLQVLLYPVTDARADSDSYRQHGEGCLLTAADMRWCLAAYLQGQAATDPRVSPLLAGDGVLAGAPPALVVIAGCDPLRDEVESYAARLAAAGVPVAVERHPDQFHGFLSFAAASDSARTALARVGAAVADALDPVSPPR